MRRALLRSLLLLLFLFVLAAGGIAALLWASLPEHEGDVVLAGLDGPVAIARDSFAVPYIRAQSERDLWRALGFVHGTDRTAQLELMRRIGRGQLAERVGERALPLDRFFRTLDLSRIAEEGLAAYSPDERALLEAYAEGVSAAFARARPLPPDLLLFGVTLEPWRPADTLLVHRLMALELAIAWQRELLLAHLAHILPPDRLAELIAAEDDALLEPVPDGQPQGLGALPRLGSAETVTSGLGSNVFVVAGARSRSGAPMLASDPHLPFQVPGPWYLAVLEVHDRVLMGGTIPGLPAVIIGRNQNVAWGLTTTGADSEDLVRIRIDPRHPDRYLVPEGSEPFRYRIETIAVRGRKPEQLSVRETRFGPIVSDLLPGARGLLAPGEELAFQWIGSRRDDRTLAAGFAIARARDREELFAALTDFASPVQNVAIADRHGRIGLAVAGRVPLRRSPKSHVLPRSWTGEADWLGFRTSDSLPRRSDPTEGFLANANEPWEAPERYSLHPRLTESALRGRRLHELLKAHPGLDGEAARTIQLDLVSGAARTLLPVLVPLLNAARPLAQGDAAAEALAGWDATMAPDRPEPLLFAAWQEALARRLLEDELGALARPLLAARPELLVEVTRAPWCDDVRTAAVESCAQMVAAAFGEAFATLSERLGDDWRRWRWGNEHPAVMPHRLLGELPLLGAFVSLRVPIGGDATTLAVAAYRALGIGGPFPAHHGPGLRLVVDLAEPGVWVVAATGQVGHPLSRHYRDLTTLWAEGRLIRLLPQPSPPVPLRHQRLLPGDSG